MRSSSIKPLARQKAWKPDCGIETGTIRHQETESLYVRRPGSPIAGLKHHSITRDLCPRKERQKAWKPDCGIETPSSLPHSIIFRVVRRPGSPIAGLKHLPPFPIQSSSGLSEGLEARLRD